MTIKRYVRTFIVAASVTVGCVGQKAHGWFETPKEQVVQGAAQVAHGVVNALYSGLVSLGDASHFTYALRRYPQATTLGSATVILAGCYASYKLGRRSGKKAQKAIKK